MTGEVRAVEVELIGSGHRTLAMATFRDGSGVARRITMPTGGVPEAEWRDRLETMRAMLEREVREGRIR